MCVSVRQLRAARALEDNIATLDAEHNTLCEHWAKGLGGHDSFSDARLGCISSGAFFATNSLFKKHCALIGPGLRWAKEAEAAMKKATFSRLVARRRRRKCSINRQNPELGSYTGPRCSKISQYEAKIRPGYIVRVSR